MRSVCMKEMVALAGRSEGPIATVVKEATELGMVAPSTLKDELEEAGYAVTFHVGPGEEAKKGDADHGAWVLIKDADDYVVGRAYSHDEEDALLQAVYAMLRDEATAEPVHDAEGTKAPARRAKNGRKR